MRNIYRMASTGKYYFKAKDRRGRWTEHAGTTDLKTTELLRNEFENRERRIFDGLESPLDEKRKNNSRRPIQEIIEEYRSHMLAKRLGLSHIKTMVNSVKAALAHCNFNCLADIEPVRFERFLGQLLAVHKRSFTTRNRYLTAVKSLLNWAVESGMLISNPLMSLHKLNEAKDPRRPSRALTEKEFETLTDKTSIPFYKAFYLVAGRCGGRWAEIARLRVKHFDFDAEELTFSADITKTGEARTLHLLPEVIASVRAIIPVDAGGNSHVFGCKPDRRTWQKHLAAAGIEYCDTSGRIADRKSLRKTFASHLIAVGTRPRELQLLMGHANIHTTMRHYSDPSLVDTRGAMQKLRRRSVDPRKAAAAV